MAMPVGAGRRARGIFPALAVAVLWLTVWVWTPRCVSTRQPEAAKPRAQADGVATRMLVEDSKWAHEAQAALQEWRSTLVARIATAYKQAEEEKSSHGEKSVAASRVEPKGLHRYDPFDPFLKCNGMELSRVGEGNTGKNICMHRELLRPGCVVYSLGSNGYYQFEEALLQETPCEVHTFDCTYDGKSLGERHFYHKICVAGEGDSGAVTGALVDEVMAYDSIRKMLNHTHVDLLKLDIEGFEYDLFAGFRQSCALPLQLAMEVHYQGLYNGAAASDFEHLHWSRHDVTLGELGVFFLHLADLGYGVVSREDNLPWGENCCSEFTLVRVEKTAGCL